MKAVDWANKFDSAKQDEFLHSYAEETAKLIAERTKRSGEVMLTSKKLVNTKHGAVDGVLREQRQKWQAIVSKLSGSSLTTEMFDTIVLAEHLPTVLADQKKYLDSKNKQTEEKGPEAVPKGVDGRKLADALT